MWSSHPISVEVQKPEEIDDIFDAISYQKVFKDIFSCGLKSFYCEVISLKKENSSIRRMGILQDTQESQGTQDT